MEKFCFILTACGFAFWAKGYIPKFAIAINQQVFQEYQSLVEPKIDEMLFQQQSRLQPKTSVWANSFFLFFPLIAFCIEEYAIATILILLVFLSVLDMCYHLTDIKFIGGIFALSLWKNLQSDYSSLFFTLTFFIVLDYLIQRLFKKACLGSGDILLFIALAPLFTLDEMLQLVLIASLSGILFYALYRLLCKQFLSKLPFIPFISVSTFCLIVAKIP